MDAAEPDIKPRDRLSFALFLVISLHAAVIFGVGFVWHAPPQERPTIEVTVAQHRDAASPEQAEFIAQADQLGSGTADALEETTTPRASEFPARDFQEVLADTRAPPAPEEAQPRPETLTTRAAANRQVRFETSVLERPEQEPHPRADDPLPTPLTPVASLDARRAQELQSEAEGPRRRRLSSVSARRSEDAAYLQAWRRQVETVGNSHYPEAALREELYGNLRLLVVIASDGALEEVRLLESSGHPVLDDAAKRIVSLAAPFEPLPEAMREDTDLLEIERTWQFRRTAPSS